ncbi:MAG TPA: fimbria/pilus periplasmic chaperone [Polymorphobacter sp.]|nr:fimbria/pilus periplasmic chaperone [Polymorphobacter sp.]
MAMLSPAAANAQSLTVSPVNIEVPSGQSTVAITVTNTGDMATKYQIRPFAWSQDADGNDVLTPTSEVMVSPPLGSIAPAADQTVRLKLRRPPQAKELSYRIILDQLPGPAVGGGTRMVLRFSIPIFAQPAAHVEPLVKWHVESRDGQRFLVAVNHGSKHAKFWEMAITAPDSGPVELDPDGAQYVLAGATQRWRMVPRKGGQPMAQTYTLSARTDGGVVKETVAIADGK